MGTQIIIPRILLSRTFQQILLLNCPLNLVQTSLHLIWRLKWNKDSTTLDPISLVAVWLQCTCKLCKKPIIRPHPIKLIQSKINDDLSNYSLIFYKHLSLYFLIISIKCFTRKLPVLIASDNKVQDVTIFAISELKFALYCLLTLVLNKKSIPSKIHKNNHSAFIVFFDQNSKISRNYPINRLNKSMKANIIF